MPKPFLQDDDARLEHEIIETLSAGLKEWRSDLDYPESYSDMQACVRGLLRMFEIKRRPMVVPLRYKCRSCDGLGHLVLSAEGGYRQLRTCPECHGRGYTPERGPP